MSVKQKSLSVWAIAQIISRKTIIYRDWAGQLYSFVSEREAQDFIDNNFKFFDKKFIPLKLRLQGTDYIELREKKFKNFAIDKF